MDFNANAFLVGSNTVRTIPMEIPPETEEDLVPPTVDPGDPRPLWVIVDSRGILKGTLHFWRKMEYIRDIVVLTSGSTPREYIDYLMERGISAIMTGTDKVDLGKAFEVLNERFGVERLLVDSGGELVSVLIEKGLVDEISLVVAPVIMGAGDRSLFRALDSLEKPIELKLTSCEKKEKGHLYMMYSVSSV